MFTLDNALVFSLILLCVVAAWNEIFFSKRTNSSKKPEKPCRDLISFIQEVLEFIFNKFVIRQILNPYFLFPFSILSLIFLKRQSNLVNSDIILLATFIALMWYSKETYELRKAQNIANKEQKKQLYLNLVEIEMRDKDAAYKTRIKYPLIIRKIIEKGEFDPKTLYSEAWHEDIPGLSPDSEEDMK